MNPRSPQPSPGPSGPAGTPARPRRIRDYFRRYRGAFALGIVCLGLTQGFALVVPRLLRMATDAAVAEDGTAVLHAALGLAAVAVLGSLARVASRILIFNSGRRVEFDIRNEVFQHLESLPPSFYQKMPVGQVMSRMVNDLTQVRLLLGPGILNLTNTSLVYVVVIPLLFYTDASLAALALIPLPILLLAGRAFGKRLYLYSREAQDRLATLSAKVQENLSGVMTVRVFRQEGREHQVFERLNTEYLDTNIKLARLRGLIFPLMGMAGAIGYVVVLYVGGYRIVEGRMTVGGFVEFSAYLATLTWPTIALGWMISLWQRGIASMERVNEIFATQPTLVDGEATPPAFVGRLEVKDLTVRYTEGGRPALDGVSFTVEPGQRVVLVGKTGCGKSTLLKALTRQLEVPRGTVFLDGVDVLDLPLQHVRAHMGYAPQDAFLFSRTLFENIAFGDPGADDAKVERAAALAQIKGEIESFPEAYHTVVGERGITLSGGQRQRTTLARAFLVEAPILVLDDTLSAVDTETETEILEGLGSAPERSLIVATHRLACAQDADRILVLHEGRLVEQGTEPELLAEGGLYAQMHRRQRIREALEHPSAPSEDAA
ncbi:MAG: ABC transporter ATP-binding protein [Myxococcales bacterium]|nr:ABC transporter ATP-binding protein [Myxococcales bacterium]MCB9646690.1 ABC transporter ATP-binding protein [Deltaproteobacteria bacterium]